MPMQNVFTKKFAQTITKTPTASSTTNKPSTISSSATSSSSPKLSITSYQSTPTATPQVAQTSVMSQLLKPVTPIIPTNNNQVQNQPVNQSSFVGPVKPKEVVQPTPPHLSLHQTDVINFRNYALRSYDFMSKQPIYERVTPNTKDPNFFKDVISGNPKAFNKDYVSFNELKASNPALYLVKDKRTGYWGPKLDTERWAREAEANASPFQIVAGRFAYGATQAFNPDFYIRRATGESEEKSYSEALYGSNQAVKSGDWGRMFGSWAGLQAPAYENVILPLAGGWAFGKIAGGVRAAGGFARASPALKAGYAGGVALTGAGLGMASYEVATKGLTPRFVISTGMQLIGGGIGFKSGLGKSPSNIYWGRSGVPTGKEYISYEKVSTSASSQGLRTNPYEFDFIRLNKQFKPSGSKELFVDFPGSASKANLNIIFSESPASRSIVNSMSGTGKEYLTIGGRRNWGYKAAWGLKRESVSDITDFNMEYIKGTLKNSPEKELLRPISNEKASASLLPISKELKIPLSERFFDIAGPVFRSKSIGFIPIVSPLNIIKSDFDMSSSVFKTKSTNLMPIISPVHIIKPDISIGVGTGQDYKPIFKNENIDKIKTIISPDVFKDFKSDVVSDVGFKNNLNYKPDFIRESKIDLVSNYDFNYDFDFNRINFKKSKFVFPGLPSKSDNRGGAGGLGPGLLKFGYHERRWKVPTLEALLNGKGW